MNLPDESAASFAAWQPSWRAEMLARPPMIAPARQFTYPLAVAGEEDALARGAMNLMVHPAKGGTFLATCALGFKDPAMPTGVFASPRADELCAVAGGYAYLVDTLAPERCVHLPIRPVVELRVAATHGLLLFVGFHAIAAWGKNGPAWETQRLSWEGVRLTEFVGDSLHGFGWDLLADKEIAFAVDLTTGRHSGGAFTQR